MLITLVDDDAGRRDAVTELLRPWARHVQPLSGFADLISRWPPGGILLVSDDGQDVDELQRKMAAQGLWRAQVLYSEVPAPTRIADAIAGGAIDYLAWPFDQTLLSERVPLWRARAGAMTTRELRRVRARRKIGALTPREGQILALLVQGLTDREIGERLGINARTSQVHRGNMLAKLGTNRSTAAVRIAMDADPDRTALPVAVGRRATARTEETDRKERNPNSADSAPRNAAREIWKTVEGSAAYEVSNLGRIRHQGTDKIKNPTDRGGELVINLYANAKTNVRYLKVIVADTFLRHRSTSEIIRHKDGDRFNCSADNLTICHKSALWPSGATRNQYAQRKLTPAMVSEIKRRLQGGEIPARVAAEFGVSVPHVCNIKNGRKWLAGEQSRAGDHKPKRPRKRGRLPYG